MDLHKDARKVIATIFEKKYEAVQLVTGRGDINDVWGASSMAQQDYIESLRQVIVRQDERIAKLEAKGQEA